jgi:hypothetical protein
VRASVRPCSFPSGVFSLPLTGHSHHSRLTRLSCLSPTPTPGLRSRSRTVDHFNSYFIIISQLHRIASHRARCRRLLRLHLRLNPASNRSPLFTSSSTFTLERFTLHPRPVSDLCACLPRPPSLSRLPHLRCAATLSNLLLSRPPTNLVRSHPPRLLIRLSCSPDIDPGGEYLVEPAIWEELLPDIAITGVQPPPPSWPPPTLPPPLEHPSTRPVTKTTLQSCSNPWAARPP